MAKDANQLKILVCSVNAWSSKVGDNTFASLLSGLPKENIASLFIREDVPDSPVSDNYFRISEAKVIDSILHPGTNTGERVFSKQANDAYVVERHNRIYGNKRKLYYPKLFVREALWLAGKWKSDELNDYIDKFSPDIVLYEMSRYIHLNRIVEYILKRTGAKGIGCFWDDTFTYKPESSLGFKLLRFFQRKSIKRLAHHTAGFFAITPKTKREADAFLGIDCTILTKPATRSYAYSPPSSEFPLRMLYTGNLSIGREDTMFKIVEGLKTVNKYKTKIVLDIYTNTNLSDDDKCKLNSPYSRLHGAICQDEVIELQNQADILLFVEGINTRNKIARLSFSTKIVDYLAAGKCIFAVGDADLAAMELFDEEQSAITVTDSVQIVPKLAQLVDVTAIQAYAQKAYSVYAQKYSTDQVRTKFYQVLTSV